MIFYSKNKKIKFIYNKGTFYSKLVQIYKFMKYYSRLFKKSYILERYYKYKGKKKVDELYQNSPLFKLSYFKIDLKNSTHPFLKFENKL